MERFHFLQKLQMKTCKVVFVSNSFVHLLVEIFTHFARDPCTEASVQLARV